MGQFSTTTQNQWKFAEFLSLWFDCKIFLRKYWTLESIKNTFFWSINTTAAVCLWCIGHTLFLLFDDLVLSDVTSIMCESFSVWTFHVHSSIFSCACFIRSFIRSFSHSHSCKHIDIHTIWVCVSVCTSI